MLGALAVISSAFRFSMARSICASIVSSFALSSTQRGTAPRLPMSCCICAKHHYCEEHVHIYHCRGYTCSTLSTVKVSPTVWSLDRPNGPTSICVTFPSKSLARSASSSDGSQKGIHRGPVRWPIGFRYSLYLLSSGECANRDCSTFGLGSKGAAPSAIYRSPGTARDFFRSSCSHWACLASQRDAQRCRGPSTELRRVLHLAMLQATCMAT